MVITRRGKPVARLISATQSNNQERSRQAVANILARGKGVKLGKVKIKDLVNEGRP